MANKQKKIASSFVNMTLVLTLVGVVSALALAFTYSLTKDAIEAGKVAKTVAAISKVIPDFDNDPNGESYTMDSIPGLQFFPAKKDSQLVGTAVRTFAVGFTEEVWIMTGFDTAGTLLNVAVLGHKETPGLGSKMSGEKFKKQFRGKDPKIFRLKVKKDGGDVDAISAATISSRAFCKAVALAHGALFPTDGEKGGETP